MRTESIARSECRSSYGSYEGCRCVRQPRRIPMSARAAAPPFRVRSMAAFSPRCGRGTLFELGIGPGHGSLQGSGLDDGAALRREAFDREVAPYVITCFARLLHAFPSLATGSHARARCLRQRERWRESIVVDRAGRRSRTAWDRRRRVGRGVRRRSRNATSGDRLANGLAGRCGHGRHKDDEEREHALPPQPPAPRWHSVAAEGRQVKVHHHQTTMRDLARRRGGRVPTCARFPSWPSFSWRPPSPSDRRPALPARA